VDAANAELREVPGGRNTDNPYKHCREHPTNPNMIECKHHQTGKWIPKPKPADWPGSAAKSEMCGPTCQSVVGGVIVGGLIVGGICLAGPIGGAAGAAIGLAAQ
jgi:predicted lipid-binding transport protein (Tim44 family)